MSMKPKLSHQRLTEVLVYCQHTGEFVWKVPMGRGGKVKAGTNAGHLTKRGYLALKIDGEIFLGHRVAWFYVTGDWPIGQIDHRDANRSNNRFSNLRDVPPSVNSQNRVAAQRKNQTGLLGVSPKRGRFVAQIQVFGKQIHIGTFQDPKSAHEAYLCAKRRLHDGCTI